MTDARLRVTHRRRTTPLFKGFNPAWNESFQFDVYTPELALVRFTIEDHDSTSGNEFIAQYTLPFNSLNMGELTPPPPPPHC